MKKDKRSSMRRNANLASRVERDNMRRVLIASALSVLLLTSLWIQYNLVGACRVPSRIGWICLAVMDIFELTYVLLAYLFIRQKKTQLYIHVIRSYWLIETIVLCVTSFVGLDKVCVMVQILLFVSGICLIPIMPTAEQIGCELLELAVLMGHVFIGTIDWERALYAIVIILFGNVVSHQHYGNYIRRVLESDKLLYMKRQAETDLLTDLMNRRGLERRISTVWPICNRQGLGVAVIMMDIDNFKKYNDTYGHGAGDSCIKAVASVIKSNARRTSDYAARVGGEEFLVFLTGISETDAVRWVIECKKEIEGLCIPHAKHNFLPFVSVSIGICQQNLRTEKKEFWELRAEADRSLYQAKGAGRACIFMNNQMYARTMLNGAE